MVWARGRRFQGQPRQGWIPPHFPFARDVAQFSMSVLGEKAGGGGRDVGYRGIAFGFVEGKGGAVSYPGLGVSPCIGGFES